MAEKKASTAGKRPKSRKHGYRGYGSGFAKNTATYGGAVHWGRGFAGVEFPGEGSPGLREAGLLSEELKERVKEKAPKTPKKSK